MLFSLSLSSLLSASTLTLLVLFIIALMPGARRRQARNTALFGLLLVNGFLVGRLVASSIWSLPAPVDRLLAIPFLSAFYLIPPLVYRFAADRTGMPGAGARSIALHVLPAMLWLVGLTIRYFMRVEPTPLFSMNGYRAYVILLHLFFTGYYVAAWRVLAHAGATGRLAPTPTAGGRFGTGLLLVVFGIHWSFSATAGLLALLPDPPESAIVFAESLSLASLLGFTATALVDALRRHPEFAARRPVRPADQLPTPEELRGLADRIERFMREHKPYLNPELTLDELSRALDIPARLTSQALNTVLGGSFFDVVNAYRVGEAQAMLGDPARRELTVLEVLYAAGFNSKSAFHRAFQKQTGMTPTAYRSRALDHTERS